MQKRAPASLRRLAASRCHAGTLTREVQRARERIADTLLLDAVARAERGLVDAGLGGGVTKQRVARLGQGRSGGYRTIILLKAGTRAVFAYGFAKNDRGNVRDDELEALRALVAELLSYDEAALRGAVEAEALMEVRGDDQATDEGPQ